MLSDAQIDSRERKGQNSYVDLNHFLATREDKEMCLEHDLSRFGVITAPCLKRNSTFLPMKFK